MNASYVAICAAVFVSAYLINIFYISVLYHRGLAHRAVHLRPWVQRWVVRSGNWVTGLDPKAWACMHRLHHRFSDTPRDPHSPWNVGVFGVMLGQLRSYEKVLIGLDLGREPYRSTVSDLKFDVNWLNRKRIWWLPYAAHAVVALVIVVGFHAWLLGAAYWLGMMSHPIQGFMVNSFAHRFGYRNFDTPDRSVNNTAVAFLVFGEGYQNNHHARPTSPKFSARWFEIDLGYALCHAAQGLGLLTIPEYRGELHVVEPLVAESPTGSPRAARQAPSERRLPDATMPH